ncbi:Succinate--CoA ligase [GDP-forming] subunit beta, mitochondrial [Cichlidogyrus casuarinus]|uniref:Succinate--CoA ligase [ADP-forming] subunit beta, mitochondrial n=1 Tax=Cichlidogyrus casuarinus TaxID=1844966 RepID=A0ABD2QIJ2_9PLAT
MQCRFLNLQEYQSKGILASYGINIQNFKVAKTIKEAEVISKQFTPNEYVVKAQILAGGRGKGTFSNGYKGGVKLTKDAKEVVNLVNKMLGQRLITKQTNSQGVLVNTVMVAEALDIKKERYIAILLDRKTSSFAIVYSNEGGMDIEEVAANTPEKIFHECIDCNSGLTEVQLKKIATNLGFLPDSEQYAVFCDQLKKLYLMFCDLDLTQVEINPFGETPDGHLVCFDVKLQFDSNAIFRQKHIQELASETEKIEVESAGPNSLIALESMAAKANLSYIGLPSDAGNIGCMVNGAGLAMATMDMVKHCGGEPANFLDLGGSVTESQVSEAFKLLIADPRVSCIFVNIFGGIVDCLTVAKGIATAVKKHDLHAHPLVVRLEGTHSKEAREYLNSSGMAIFAADDFLTATQLAVKHASTPQLRDIA